MSDSGEPECPRDIEAARARHDAARKEVPDPHHLHEITMLQDALCQPWLSPQGRVTMRLRIDHLRTLVPPYILRQFDTGATVETILAALDLRVGSAQHAARPGEETPPR